LQEAQQALAQSYDWYNWSAMLQTARKSLAEVARAILPAPVNVAFIVGAGVTANQLPGNAGSAGQMALSFPDIDSGG